MSPADGERIVARDGEALAALAADRLARLTQELSAGGARLQVALAGGRTPRRCYELLAQDARRPVAHWEAWLGDERCVPEDDPASNFAMLRETLVDPGALAPEHLHAVPTAYGAARAAAAYALLFPARLDLLLLGMGDDGHTASLFPGAPTLDETRERVVAATSPRPPKERVTITPPVIAAADHVIVLVSGEDKAETLARVLEGPLDVHALPAQLARHGLWIVDRAAAARLRILKP
jgi:6-phosphogluconolactonase